VVDPGVIDLHSHVLPGLDDGATTLDDALAIARGAAADGVRVLAATPHVRGDFPTTAVAMRDSLGQVRTALAAAGIALEIVPGAEIGLDRLALLTIDDLEAFALGGASRTVLVEFPYVGWPLQLAEDLGRLLDAGVRPVLAHPERNADVQEAPGRLAHLVEAGVLVQVTASSLTGRGGTEARRTAFRLLDDGLCHLVASDSHRPPAPGGRMSSAREAVKDASLARWLTLDVPAAIVSGTKIPERPAMRARRRLFRFGR
jgi:protein-tyrosine phosphatase